MASTRPDIRPVTVSGQGSDETTVTPADRLRDALAIRCGELEANRPEVLDLVAETLEILRGHLAGRAASLAGNRSAKYFREALRGEHALTLEDLARLAIDAPLGVSAALAKLARRAGYQMVPDDVIGPDSALAALIDLVESGGRCLLGLQRALLKDGGRRIGDEDRQALQFEADKLMRRVCAFQQALEKGGAR